MVTGRLADRIRDRSLRHVARFTDVRRLSARRHQRASRRTDHAAATSAQRQAHQSAVELGRQEPLLPRRSRRDHQRVPDVGGRRCHHAGDERVQRRQRDHAIEPGAQRRAGSATRGVQRVHRRRLRHPGARRSRDAGGRPGDGSAPIGIGTATDRPLGRRRRHRDGDQRRQRGTPRRGHGGAQQRREGIPPQALARFHRPTEPRDRGRSLRDVRRRWDHAVLERHARRPQPRDDGPAQRPGSGFRGVARLRQSQVTVELDGGRTADPFHSPAGVCGP